MVLKFVPSPCFHIQNGYGLGMRELGRSNFPSGTRRKVVLQNHRKEYNYTMKYSEQPVRRAFTTLPQKEKKRKT